MEIYLARSQEVVLIYSSLGRCRVQNALIRKNDGPRARFLPILLLQVSCMPLLPSTQPGPPNAYS